MTGNWAGWVWQSLVWAEPGPDSELGHFSPLSYQGTIQLERGHNHTHHSGCCPPQQHGGDVLASVPGTQTLVTPLMYSNLQRVNAA